MFAVAIPLFLASAVTPPRPPPFGIAQGTPVARLRVRSRYGTKFFVIIPPVTNELFDNYTATATPLHGVCGLKARTPLLADAALASEKLDQISKMLGVYGQPILGDMPDDLPWTDISPASMADYRERYWSGSLPNGLRSISASIEGTVGNYRIAVRYYFKNMPACANWEPGQNTKGL